MRGLTPVLLLALLAGCSSPEPLETFTYDECAGVGATAPLNLTVDRAGLRHVLFVASHAMRPASCVAPSYDDVAAIDGRLQSRLLDFPVGEVRLFFADGTFRMAVQIPQAEAHDLQIMTTKNGSAIHNGVMIAVTRSEWLMGPEAGADAHLQSETAPLGDRSYTWALVVDSAWNQGLGAYALVYPESGEEGLPDGGGSVEIRLISPSGAVVGTDRAGDPRGEARINVKDPQLGVWTLEVREVASAEDAPSRLAVVNADFIH